MKPLLMHMNLYAWLCFVCIADHIIVFNVAKHNNSNNDSIDVGVGIDMFELTSAVRIEQKCKRF